MPTLFLPNNDAGKTRQGAAQNANPLATLNVAMRLYGVRPGKPRANRFHVFVWHRGWVTLEPNQSGNPGDLQHLQPVSQRQPDKDITREKRKLQPHTTVFPA